MTKEHIKCWVVALATCTTVFIVFSVYLYLRRGYYDLYIINKVLGSASLVALGLVLLIGPLSRLYQRFDHWLCYRKEIGIIGFLAAFAHMIISLFLLPEKFKFISFFTYTSLNRGLVPFLLGLASIMICIILTILSFESIKRKTKTIAWWHWQYRGVRIAFLFLFLHLIFMKYPGWIDWYVKGSTGLARPFMPPGSIIAGSIGLFVLLVRLAEVIDTKVAKIVIPVLLFFLIAFWLESFAWGILKP
ncbi:ferric reductase-like transmembrane domain-containing protein [Candidatus Gottesmanbacteria bacterium]|nr:ferric reductase-like transmembrane domain-containing protein [Candidatus Gottesmanbacteria bacterium]